MSRGGFPASPDGRTVTTGESETNHQHACPLCEFQARKRADIYTHLQTSHRKSTLATTVLDETMES